MPRLIRFLAAVALLALAGCASTATNRNALVEAQSAWSAAIRWGNFEGAQNLVDPAVRAQRTPTAVELERYGQVQISGYRDVGASSDEAAGTAVRDIEIGVIGRHTQAERNVRHRETWRYDAATKRWWNTSGLPDLWAGQ